MNIVWGMKILWSFLGGNPKIGLLLRVISMYFRVNIQNRDVLGGCKNFKYCFFGP